MGPARMVGGHSQSSGNSGIFFQGDSQSQNIINSYLSSSFGNSGNSISGTGRSNLGSVSSDIILNSVGNSGPSVGASSLVTDANSSFSGGPHLQRSASINTDAYTRLPASPLSFTSNNNNISGSSVIDDHNSQPGACGSQMGQYPLNMGPRMKNNYMQDSVNLAHLQKKQRVDIKQEDMLQQQVLHQMLQTQDPMLQSSNPQIQAILHQQRVRQQQQMLQNMSPMQRLQLQQLQHQQQQQQLRQQIQQQQQLQQQAKNPYDTGGVCARRLMQYLYHQRQRPAENSIAYWRKFVAEYYAPRAKKRWCLSLYENVGQHALGVFPPASMDAWHCDICGSKSGRGFEATYEVLPRLNEIEFGSGVIDELLFVDLPRERRFVNGIMILEYGKAIQETVYEQLRVVREGQLRVVFTQDLKILSWDFCARRHEELLPRRLVAPQVNQLLQVAQKCQSTISESGPEGVSSENLQTNSNMVVAAGRQLAKSLEMQSLNDLGFSKRYVRCLQIAEVVNSMKDLVDFSRDNKLGPIDGLKSYPRYNPNPNPTPRNNPMQRMHEMEHPPNIPGLPSDRNTINKLMAMQSGFTNTPNNRNILTNNPVTLNGPALTNYQNMIRQNSFNSNPNSLHQEASSSFQGLQRSVSSNGPPGPFSDQQMIRQLIQEVNNAGGPQKSFSCQSMNGGTAPASTLSKSNSFKAPSNSESSAVLGGSNSGFNHNKMADMGRNINVTDDMVPDLPHDFAESDFFGSDLDDNLGDLGWKA